MKTILETPRWSPYWVGAGIGVLSWITFYFMGKALGASTTMVRAVGVVEGVISEQHVRQNAYLAKYLVGHSAFEWQAALVLMMAVGAYIAARLARSTRREHVPSIWAERFGTSRTTRYVGAFAGGALLLFGARLAGGCTSGHGVSGGLQLALSSWTFLITMFGAAIATAFVVYGKGAKTSV